MTNIQHLTVHLTEDQLTDYLIDPAGEDATAQHLAGCAACTAKLAEFRVSMESFSTLSLAWSEQRSITTPLRPTRTRSVRWLPNTMPGWSAAIAAALLLAIAVPMDLHLKEHQPSSAMQGDAGMDQDSEAQIQRDNQLMRAVSLEINRREPSPLVALNEPAQSTSAAKRRSDVSSE